MLRKVSKTEVSCWEDCARRGWCGLGSILWAADPEWMGVARGYWDADHLGVAIRQTEARLVIVDTIQTFAEIWRKTRWLDQLRRLALEHNCCILLIRYIPRPRTVRMPAQRLGNIDLSSAVSSEPGQF